MILVLKVSQTCIKNKKYYFILTIKIKRDIKNVYIFIDNFCGSDIHGCYSTYELAEQGIN
jgi:Mor family transcriptional regulator